MANRPTSFVQNGLMRLRPGARIAALADGAGVESLDSPRPSPHLARYGIAAQEDDGVALARIALGGEPVLIAAQDGEFLRGSVGVRHGEALRELFVRARRERPAGVVLLAASGGVRLHEANGSELALARALAAMLDLRASGVPVVIVGVGDVFGGASVLAAAADRLALLEGVRIGASGPRVIESVHGRWELDASDPEDVDQVFGAAARARDGFAELLVDDVDAIRAWILFALRNPTLFRTWIKSTHARHARKLGHAAPRPLLPPALRCFADAKKDDAAGTLWRAREAWLIAPFTGLSLGAAEAHAIDAALLRNFAALNRPAQPALVVVEDSAGHAVSRAEEMRFVSGFLALHAATLALLRAAGCRLTGLLAGTGHSAAFFANAMQCPTLLAFERARVVAMEPSALSRVTGIDPQAMIESDPLLGHPVRHFAAQGGIAAFVGDVPLADIVTLGEAWHRASAA